MLDLATELFIFMMLLLLVVGAYCWWLEKRYD